MVDGWFPDINSKGEIVSGSGNLFLSNSPTDKPLGPGERNELYLVRPLCRCGGQRKSGRLPHHLRCCESSAT